MGWKGVNIIRQRSSSLHERRADTSAGSGRQASKVGANRPVHSGNSPTIGTRAARN